MRNLMEEKNVIICFKQLSSWRPSTWVAARRQLDWRCGVLRWMNMHRDIYWVTNWTFTFYSCENRFFDSDRRATLKVGALASDSKWRGRKHFFSVTLYNFQNSGRGGGGCLNIVLLICCTYHGDINRLRTQLKFCLIDKCACADCT